MFLQEQRRIQKYQWLLLDSLGNWITEQTATQKSGDIGEYRESQLRSTYLEQDLLEPYTDGNAWDNFDKWLEAEGGVGWE